MLGAIIGDIIGSPYEWNYIKTTEFPLFSDESYVTDDSILTVATADAILSGNSFESKYREYVTKYPYAGYGSNFYKWAVTPNSPPGESYGNGSAMRVSPVGWACNCYNKMLSMAIESASCSHGHVEGIKGACFVARAIMASGHSELSKDVLKEYLCKHYPSYDLDISLDEIRPTYTMDERCQGTVPQAFRCFYEANSFEETVRLAVSLGGDSDTLACIAGSIAETLYEIPDEIATKAYVIFYKRCPELNPIVVEFMNKYVRPINEDWSRR